MTLKAQRAALAHDSAFTADAIDQRAKGAWPHVIWQPRPQRFHLKARRQRLRLVMLRECVERETLQLLPSRARGESLFVAN